MPAEPTSEQSHGPQPGNRAVRRRTAEVATLTQAGRIQIVQDYIVGQFRCPSGKMSLYVGLVLDIPSVVLMVRQEQFRSSKVFEADTEEIPRTVSLIPRSCTLIEQQSMCFSASLLRGESLIHLCDQRTILFELTKAFTLFRSQCRAETKGIRVFSPSSTYHNA